MEKCLICRRSVPDYEPVRCCDGRECACMGMPINPCICSDECDAALRLPGKFHERRKAAGIASYTEVTCPQCHTEQDAKVINSGKGYNTEFGQTEYWFEAELKCSCGFDGVIGDSSL